MPLEASMKYLYILAATPLEPSIGILNFFLNNMSMLRLSLYIKQISFFCDFFWEDDGTLPQNSYKPSRDLCEKLPC